MKHKSKAGVTVPEVIGVLTLVTVLCASFVPYVLEFREATNLSKLRFNLDRLRLRIDEYRQRTGRPPKLVEHLFDSKYESVFENPFCLATNDARNRIKLIDVHPPNLDYVSPANRGAWLYNPETGGIWADTASFLEE